MLDTVAQLTLVILAVTVIVTLVRLIKGPTLPDRVVAMDLLGVVVVGFIVVLAASTRVSATLDAAMVIALIGFVATVAYAVYVERGHAE
jgi:multicomponent Na+:H+ antiporter subunit F